jgi:hypothetical protein
MVYNTCSPHEGGLVRFAVIVSILLMVGSAGAAGRAVENSKWIRISAADNNMKKIEVCNYELTKCSQLGKKKAYSVQEIDSRRKTIRKIRNRTVAVQYAMTFLTIAVSPVTLSSALINGTHFFQGTPYQAYIVALDYVTQISDAYEIESLGSAQILVESDQALNVLRAALDAK